MSRREYVARMRQRYAGASRSERASLLDEIVQVTRYNRKYAIRVLQPAYEPKPSSQPRRRARLYGDCIHAIALVWEALDYCCAERLHPHIARVAQQLAADGMLALAPHVREQLEHISRATLARRLAELPPPDLQLVKRPGPQSLLRSEVPIGRYAWDEQRPGALEVDLLEHGGPPGRYLCTLSCTDVVSGWTLHRAIAWKDGAAVRTALQWVISAWPHRPWALHVDNGAEFLNQLVLKFAKSHSIDSVAAQHCHRQSRHG